MSASAIESLVIAVEGYKAIKDADLADLLGLGLPEFYKRIGRKLWYLGPGMCFQLSKRYARGRLDAQPPLAFSMPGVLLIAGILGDDDSLDIGMDVVYALRNLRRSSANKKRRARRADHAERAADYSEARARLMQGRLHDLLKKQRRH